MKIADVLKAQQDTPEALAALVRKALRRRPLTLQELSSRFDRGVSQIEHAIEILQAEGYHVKVAEGEAAIPRDLPQGGIFRIDPKLIHGNRYKFGIISDTHYGSKYAREDVAESLYDLFAERGIREVFHCGNIVDGTGRLNQFDLRDGCFSMAGQAAYMAKHYPRRKGITTRFIVGECHEGWWVKEVGFDVGKYLEGQAAAAGRDDLKYIGYLEADVLFPAERGKTWMRLIHPGGGTAYALSYVPQKLIESLQGGEKPAIVVIGHHHKIEYCRPREVCSIQAGCTQDQTAFMRKHKLEAHLGGWLVEFEQAKDGHVSGIQLEDRRYFDRGFYQGKEKFQRW